MEYLRSGLMEVGERRQKDEAREFCAFGWSMSVSSL